MTHDQIRRQASRPAAMAGVTQTSVQLRDGRHLLSTEPEIPIAKAIGRGGRVALRVPSGVVSFDADLALAVNCGTPGLPRAHRDPLSAD